LPSHRPWGPGAAKGLLDLAVDATSAPTEEELAEWALELSHNARSETAKARTTELGVQQQLAQNLMLAERLELTDTPQLFVNGAHWSAAEPQKNLDALLRKELAASKAARGASTSPELHYARRVQENWSSRSLATRARVVSPLAGDGPEPTWGSPNAPVTVVEFADFQCPFCSRVQPTLAGLKRKYGPEKLRLVFKHNPLPFHPNARPAHEAAVAVFRLVGEPGFWRYHDRLFESQKELTPENFERWAQEVFVSPQALRQELERGKPARKIDEDKALALKVGATGTPGFRINGVTLNGAQPADKFEEVIDEQLAKAEQLRAEGIPRRDVSAVLTKRQLTTAEPKPEPPTPAEDRTVWRVPVSQDDPQDGPSDALVTVVEFADLQCPFCKRVQGTLQALRAKYGRDLRIIWKDNPLPFHPRAKPAATVARAVYAQGGNAAFWQIVADIFESAPKLEDYDLKLVLQRRKLSWKHAAVAVMQDRFASKFEESLQIATDFSARNTPHFFINGVRLSGAQPQEKFEVLIDQELARTRVLLDEGVPRAKIFETIMRGATPAAEPEKKTVAPAVGGAPFRGPANAKVVIEVFADFQCPFCKRINPTLDTLLKANPQVKLVWRNLPLPFHQDADLAAQAAHEVFLQLGSAKFWKYHELLFAAQGQTDGLKRPNLEALAKQVGANLARFRAALDAQRHQARIESDKAAAQAAGINNTPSFVIGGYFLSGAQPLPAFEALIRRVQAAK
jgi:protein-disulfide isomerase